jgi:hypothetical protein
MISAMVYSVKSNYISPTMALLPSKIRANCKAISSLCLKKKKHCPLFLFKNFDTIFVEYGGIKGSRFNS